MTAATALAPPSHRTLAQAVIVAGLAGGAVDFVYANGVALAHGRSMLRPWQGVASGWIGKAASEGGLAAAGLGVVTHFGIALCMAAAFALVAARVRPLHERPLAAGALYGLVLYGVMYRIVLPLRFPQVFPRWDGVQSLTDIAAHIGVGLAIATVLSRFFRAILNR